MGTSSLSLLEALASITIVATWVNLVLWNCGNLTTREMTAINTCFLVVWVVFTIGLCFRSY